MIPRGLEEGQIVTVNKWLKKMGYITWPGESKRRNPVTMLRKGHLIAALIVQEKDEWDAAAPETGDSKFTFYKRIKSTHEVTVGKDRVVCFRSISWDKMTNKNMFMAQFKDKDETES